MESYDQALNWAGEALRRDPENVAAWFVRTTVYYEQENWKATKEALEEAMRIDPYEGFRVDEEKVSVQRSPFY
ncbi:hypothetical protein [Paenibacillus sp. sgz302251]|uniref:hypothetical protein n=1 Tax=Paenibacillus sp. sgz302251 TaxID=3414493 RepID=UPI003C7D1654